jgi:hypothetical protein
VYGSEALSAAQTRRVLCSTYVAAPFGLELYANVSGVESDLR